MKGRMGTARYTRKMARLELSLGLIQQLVDGAREEGSLDVPEDVEVCAIDQTMGGFSKGTFDVYVRSKEFKDVKQGQEPPLHPPVPGTD